MEKSDDGWSSSLTEAMGSDLPWNLARIAGPMVAEGLGCTGQGAGRLGRLLTHAAQPALAVLCLLWNVLPTAVLHKSDFRSYAIQRVARGGSGE